MSRAVLKAAACSSVIIVTEPYHLWRAERLARASAASIAHFDVQYAAAPTSCWQRWGMAFKGALREPLAIVKQCVGCHFGYPRRGQYRGPAEPVRGLWKDEP